MKNSCVSDWRTQTVFNVNNTDLYTCDWNGKTYINYLCGNQLGNYWMAEEWAAFFCERHNGYFI